MSDLKRNIAARRIVEVVAEALGVTVSHNAWESAGSRKARIVCVELAVRSVERILEESVRLDLERMK